MKQTRLESLLEAFINQASGFIISFLAWMYIVPKIWPELKTTAQVGFWVTVFFFMVSIIRSYFWRRFFNKGIHKWVHSLIAR